MRLLQRLARQHARTLQSILVLALAMVILAPDVRAQSVVPVQIDDQTVQQGDTITVPIRLSQLGQATEITSYGFDIDFGDDNVLSYVDFQTENTLSGDAGFTVNANENVPRIGAFFSETDEDENPVSLNDVATDGNGVMLRLQFEVVGTPSSTVTLSNFQFNGGDPASDPSTPSFLVSVAENLVSLPSLQAAAGDTIDVPVSTSDLTGLGVSSFNFDLQFDGAVLEPVEVSTEGTLSEQFIEDGGQVSGTSPSQNVFRVGGFAPADSSLEGSGTLVVVRFFVEQSGTSALAFQEFKFNDGTPTAATTDGSINAISTPPIANGDSYSVNEDDTLSVSEANGVLTNDDDPDTENLSASLVTPPSNAASFSLNSDGSFTYVPVQNFNGEDSFRYEVSDGNSTDQATATITVEPVNDAPSITALSDTTIQEDEATDPKSFQVSDVESSPDSLTLSGASSDTDLVPVDSIKFAGSASNPTVMVVPAANENGQATITVTVTDEGGATASESFILTVTPVEDPPVARADSFGVQEDDQLRVLASNGVLANDFDPDGDDLSVSSVPVEDVSHGSLSLNPDGSFVYTPDDDFAGTDSFVYQVSDGDQTSNATVEITIEQVNDQPTITQIEDRTIREDSSASAQVTIGDVETSLEDLVLSATSSDTSVVPSDGIVFSGSGETRTVQVTPAPDSNGTTTIGVTVTDAAGADSTVRFTLTVEPVNDVPVAVADTFSVPEDATLSVPSSEGVLANDSDVESSMLTASLVEDVANGTLSFNSDGSFTYDPDDNFSGEDTFAYAATDGAGASDTAMVSIQVEMENDPPVATSDSYLVLEDDTLRTIAESADVTGLNADLTALQSGANGGFGSGTSEASGSVRFIVNGSEGEVTSIDYELTVEGLDFSGFVDGAPSTTDPDDDVIGLHVHNAPRGETGGIQFGVIGSQSSPFATDATDDQDRRIVALGDQVLIQGSWDVDEATSPDEFAEEIFGASEGEEVPLYLNLHTTGNQGGEIRGQLQSGSVANGVLANDTDADGDALTASLVSGVASGALTLNADGTFTYVPDANFNGQDRFTYEVSDGRGGTDLATATIVVDPVNDPPMFTQVPADTTTFTDSTLTVQFLANDVDEGDQVRFSLVDPPANASVDSLSGAFTFAPEVGQQDSTYTFTVQAEDSEGALDEASFSVTVNLGFTPGDPSGNGQITAFDASIALQAFAGIIDLTVPETAAADVTENGEVSPADASCILQSVVGVPLNENCTALLPDDAGAQVAAAKSGTVTGQLNWGSMETTKDGATFIPVRLEGDVRGVYGLGLTLTGDVRAIDTDRVTSQLPEGWSLVHHSVEREGKLVLAMAGPEPIMKSGEVVRLALKDGSTDRPEIQATGMINELDSEVLGAAPIVDLPEQFSLKGNFPNPFSQSTSITLDSPSDATVEVAVFDMLGRRVLSIPARSVSAGEGRTIQIDGSRLSSGVYLYRLRADTDSGEWVDSGRMVVVK